MSDIILRYNAGKILILLKNISHITERNGETVFHSVSDKSDNIRIPLSWDDIASKIKPAQYPDFKTVVDI